MKEAAACFSGCCGLVAIGGVLILCVIGWAIYQMHKNPHYFNMGKRALEPQHYQRFLPD